MSWMNSNDYSTESYPGFVRRSLQQHTLIVGFSLLFVLLYAALAQAGPQQKYLEARSDFYTLLKSNTKQQYRHNWDKVLTPLHSFVDTYPQHSKAASAYYLLGKAYTRLAEISHLRSDLDRAVTMFSRVDKLFPDSSLADDAIYLQAKLYLERYADKRKAAQLCQRLLSRYPDGDMCSAAEHIIEQSGYSFAEHKNVTHTANPPSAADNFLADVRYSISSERVRVVIETTTSTPFNANSLSAPARVYVDIPGVKNPQTLAERYTIKHNDSVLKTIRIGHDGESARVVCDLTQAASYNVFNLDEPSRIVIDIANDSGLTVTSDSEEIRVAPSAAKDHVETLLSAATGQVGMVSLPSKNRGSKRLCIVVDPGHGGKDPGAVGANNLYEKDITLAVSKKLAQTLRKHIDCDVHLTRTKDAYLTLRQRTAMANRLGADVFISVHANASVNKSAHGTETYFLNFSKNNKAVEVAARENDMSLQEVGDLELILFDLMANSKINESSRLATEVQNSMITHLKKRFSGIRDLGVRQGPFHVLLGADMPSILVEAAFVSNSHDAKLLLDRDFQSTTADAVALGVKAYLRGQNMVADN